MIPRTISRSALVALAVSALLAAACGGKKAPVARPAPPPPTGATAGSGAAARPSATPRLPDESIVVPPEPMADDRLASASLDEINRSSPLAPVFFELDSSELSAEARQTLDANARILQQRRTWIVTIEGHCDERGTAEYNLALGERRALAARDYLLSLGLPADRLRTLSYGKEFPFDPGHDETAYAKNRRAHFVVAEK